MLPADQRVRRSAEFKAVVRAGRRYRSGALVVYLLPGRGRWRPDQKDPGAAAAPPARAGLIVGKLVGNSVVRHRVSRRLREQLRTRMSALTAGDLFVVRALPAAAEQASSQLGRDLDNVLVRISGTVGS